MPRTRGVLDGWRGRAPPVLRLGDVDDGLELLLDDLLGFAALALLERLADAEDHAEPGIERHARLGRDQGGGLAEDAAALRVACARRQSDRIGSCMYSWIRTDRGGHRGSRHRRVGRGYDGRNVFYGIHVLCVWSYETHLISPVNAPAVLV